MQTGSLSPTLGTTAQTLVVEASEQATLPAPDKQHLLDHLSTVKTLLESATAASTLVPAVIAAIEVVHKLF
ncbi:hypothetical protein KDA_46940 [Dictyobacter alpinus]|uniref:Uncharacterized protein n=1 Tax=Dictyobacter alpinus TaxID=2014873 RepID=A0A402BD15_9CHLR|nr:hypothetical protein [Dictyobacter alpinus]GCE29210.1 hypothetical protein KDA_46940 [Dictyobacter alpinus]